MATAIGGDVIVKLMTEMAAVRVELQRVGASVKQIDEHMITMMELIKDWALVLNDHETRLAALEKKAG